LGYKNEALIACFFEAQTLLISQNFASTVFGVRKWAPLSVFY